MVLVTWYWLHGSGSYMVLVTWYWLHGSVSYSRLPWRVEHHQQGLVLRRQVLELLPELEHVAAVTPRRREEDAEQQRERREASHRPDARGGLHSFMNHNKDNETLPAVSRAGGT